MWLASTKMGLRFLSIMMSASTESGHGVKAYSYSSSTYGRSMQAASLKLQVHVSSNHTAASALASRFTSVTRQGCRSRVGANSWQERKEMLCWSRQPDSQLLTEAKKLEASKAVVL